MKFFSLIYQGDLHPSNEEKIIPAEDFSTLMEAAEVLEKAKEDAIESRKQIEKEAKEKFAAAKAEGFQEGLNQFTEKMAWFDTELKRLRIELQKQVLPIALKAARKIVARELELHPEVIVDIVMQVLAPIAQSKQVTIYVAKPDREAMEAAKPRLKQLMEQIESFIILDRADITPGGCIIETEDGILNATVENQWRALETAFERYMKP
jgi:type III secretion protein L